MAFAGYWIKIGGNNFTSPAPKEYSSIKNIMDISAERVASGVLHREIAPHTPYKVFLVFPPMTAAQWQTYYALLNSNSISVEFWDTNTGTYLTKTMYPNELTPKELLKGHSERWIDSISFNLIEY